MLLKQQDYLKIGLIALMSRVLTLLFAKYCSLHYIPYDKSSTMYPTNSPFSFLNSWDSIHFLSIADNGYTYEHALPFLPLLPYISKALNFSDHLTTGIVLNNIVFVISALVLYKTSLMTFSKRVSEIATMLFVFNPASIIFSSFYSESLFTLIFLLGYFYIMKDRMLKASILFALAGLCRSNAVLFVMFLKPVYVPVVLLPVALFQCYSLLLMWKVRCSFRILIPYSYLQKIYWDHGFLRFFSINNIPNILIGLPIISYCLYILKKFATFHVHLFKLERQRMSTYNNDQKCPGLRHYGPDINSKTEFYTNHFKSMYHNDTASSSRIKLSDIPEYIKHVFSLLVSANTLTGLILDPFFCKSCNLITKLAIILALQTFILAFFIHWNMAVRFISFNPFIYWISALATQAYFHTRRFRAVAGFFFVYGVLYIVMFSCFYPPA